MTRDLTAEQLAENFELLDDWEQRYRYLIELGDSLPPMEAALKTDACKVEGCTSQVWLVPVRDSAGKFDFMADSDAAIVRGLIAILRILYAGKSPQDAVQVDAEAVFRKLGLDQHLSPNRRNGFFALVRYIQALAAKG